MARYTSRSRGGASRKRPVARRSPARGTRVRRSASPRRAPRGRVTAGRRKTTARRQPQTIRIVVEQQGSTLARPDITEDALTSSKIEKGKRRAKL